MLDKGASELNKSLKEEQLEEELIGQINKIKALIKQDVVSHIPHKPGEEIEVIDIEYNDYMPLGEVDYKGLSCIVHYTRKTKDEQGNAYNIQEHMVFSMNRDGSILEGLATIDQDGLIKTTPEYREKIGNAQNAQLIKENNEKSYLVRKDNKLQVISEEEKERQMSEEEQEKEEIAQSYRQMKGEKQQEDDGDEILSVTEIEDPRPIARVLDLPLDRIGGKYKLVRFRGNKFILVDDNNQVVAGLDVSELATDIHEELNIRSQDPNAKIKGRELEAATTEPRKI